MPRVTPASLIGLDEAAALVPRGATIMVGGFGLVGKPVALVEQLLRHPGATGLTVISNNVGEPGRGLGLLLAEGRIAKAIGSYFTSNRDAVIAHAEGRLEVELLPQGTMAEAIRAGGAGIAAFYVATAAGTLLAEGRETREFGGVPTSSSTRCAPTSRCSARAGRRARQPRVRQDRAQLQPRHGDRRRPRHRPGR